MKKRKKLILNINRFTTDKASSNISLAKTFQDQYYHEYFEEIYNVLCVAHTFNNVVGDVLNWLLPKNRDDQEIRNMINLNQLDLDQEDERQTYRKSILIFLSIFF